MLKQICTLMDKLCKKLGEKGQGMVEYALILAAVAIIAVFAIWGTENSGTSLKESVGNAFTTAANKVTEAQNEGNTTQQTTQPPSE